MPLYFLHVKHSEGLDEDLEGMSFDTIDDARATAADTLRNEVADGLRSASQIDISGIEITDPTGATVAVVSIEDAVLSQLGSDTPAEDT